MQTSSNWRPVSERVPVRSRMTIALIGAGVLALIVAGWQIAASRHRPAARVDGEELAPRDLSSTTETNDLRRELRRLEGQVAALQLTTARPQAPAGTPSGADPAGQRSAREAQSEIRLEHLRKLEGLLTTDTGGPPVRSAEAAASSELIRALGTNGRVAAIKCTTTFCRVVLEDDGKGDGINIPALARTAPSLRQEALYDYEQRGAVKRTIIYVARAGHQLPLSRAAGPEDAEPSPL